MTCFFEPVKGAGNERRDELGNTAPYRSQPHRGSDWGFSNGSEGKDIWAMHSGKITKSWNDPALGHSVIVQLACTCKFNGYHIEYNHMKTASPLKVGAEVIANKTVIGPIGATGSSLSKAGANHLHASMAKDAVPHVAPREHLIDLFKVIDKSFKERADARKAAKETNA